MKKQLLICDTCGVECCELYAQEKPSEYHDYFEAAGMPIKTTMELCRECAKKLHNKKGELSCETLKPMPNDIEGR